MATSKRTVKPRAAPSRAAVPLLYSPHFSRRELTFSETAARAGINNTPTAAVERNLVRLCTDFLEPLRGRFGAISVSSGYRSPALNAAINGSKTSAHMTGRAADLKPVNPSVRLVDVVRWLQASKLPFDQVIYEYGRWVHVGIAAAGATPRRQALMIFSGGTYLPYDPGKIPARKVA